VPLEDGQSSDRADWVRRAARTDSTQKSIVDRLRQLGCQVYYIKEPVDLLVGCRGKNLLLEVKAEDGRLTKAQVDFIATWPGPVHVVRSADEAAEVISKEIQPWD
jgi:hypothetical protein